MDYQTDVMRLSEEGLELSSVGDISLFPVKLDGIEEALYTESGLPYSVILNRDTAWRNIVFKAGSRLNINRHGDVQSGVLASDQAILQVYYKFTFAGGQRVHFFENGYVQAGYLSKNDKSLGAPYELTVEGNSRIVFFDNGTLNTARLKDSIIVGGYATKPKAQTVFTVWDYTTHTLPSIRWTEFAQDTVWGEYTAKAKKQVIFDNGANIQEPGSVISFTTVTDVLVQGLFVLKDTPLNFYESGMVRQFQVGAEQVIQNIKVFPNETQITMRESGKIDWLISSHQLTVQGKTYDRWAKILLDEDGNVITSN